MQSKVNKIVAGIPTQNMESKLSEATQDDEVKMNNVLLKVLGRSHDSTQIRLNFQ